MIYRLEDDPERNAERWKKMPPLANYQSWESQARRGGADGRRRSGQAANAAAGHAELRPRPHGGVRHRRKLALADAAGPSRDKTHAIFWQQLLRWLVADTPGQVMASTPKQVLSDERQVHLRAEVREQAICRFRMPRGSAHRGTRALRSHVELKPVPLEEGVYTAMDRREAGSYVAEIVANAGAEGTRARRRDVPPRRRRGGEFPHRTRIANCWRSSATQTGGHYIHRDGCASKLATRYLLFGSRHHDCARRRICGICRSYSCWR